MRTGGGNWTPARSLPRSSADPLSPAAAHTVMPSVAASRRMESIVRTAGPVKRSSAMPQPRQMTSGACGAWTAASSASTQPRSVGAVR